MSEHTNEGMSPQEDQQPSLPLDQEIAAIEAQMVKEQVNIDSLEPTIDEQSYVIGEVPQAHLYDPEISLPLNSDKLERQTIQSLVDTVDHLTRHEITTIQHLQKSIDNWEKKVEQSKILIEKNKGVIKQNNTEIFYDEKNRDYWWRRAENVITDYNTAQAANHIDTWAWFVKKHGLRNLDGTPIPESHACIEELCNGGASNLAGKYKVAGNKYDMTKKDKESLNYRLIAENSRYKATIDTLQKYIQSTYQDRIQPLQDGVLLLKELGGKLRQLSGQGQATFGDLRDWAEEFLSDYLVENPSTPPSAVTDFRRIASIPLPPENS